MNILLMLRATQLPKHVKSEEPFGVIMLGFQHMTIANHCGKHLREARYFNRCTWTVVMKYTEDARNVGSSKSR